MVSSLPDNHHAPPIGLQGGIDSNTPNHDFSEKTCMSETLISSFLGVSNSFKVPKFVAPVAHLKL